MSMSRNTETSTGFTPADIYFVVFRHKWKILGTASLGLVAAAVFYFAQQPLYQSDAEIFIRYVSDSHPVNPSDNNSRVTSLIDMGQNVLNSEMHILSSLDLVAEVATNVGPSKILAKFGGGNDAIIAAVTIRKHLKVEAARDSSVINVTFRHSDPDLVRPVLSELITDYQDRHVQIHKAIGMSDDTLADQTSQLRMQINATEQELMAAKTNAGVISITDAEKSYEDEIARIRRELFESRAMLAEHQMGLRDSATAAANTNTVLTNTAPAVPAEELAHYKNVCGQLNYLDRKMTEYQNAGYTESNKLVKENREQAIATAKLKTDLETKYPSLAELDTSVPVAGASTAQTTGTSEAVMVASLPLRIKELQAQFDEVQSEAAKLNVVETRIAELERKKKLQEDNYKYFISMLEQARIDEALGPGRVSNIQVIQQPSPPYKDYGKFFKNIGAIMISGLALGLAWALLIEFYLDRTVKRPVDLQAKLRIPFFLSIPDLNYGENTRLSTPDRKQLAYAGDAAGNGNGGTALEIAVPAVNHALHSHCDALRDRLVSYFESINLTRKPKLVAITSAGKGAGVSTISAGLAASLSETGDGRVLLVDMNLENGAAQQFVRGKPDCQLDDALISDKRDNALVQENLYVVSEGSNADKLPRVLPKRFASLVPKLKASDYDYIIFDMPPVTQTSVTTRLSGFMDTVMLVVESERTDLDVIQQANQMLLQSKANVTTVLNKTRNYIPYWLHRDIHSGT